MNVKELIDLLSDEKVYHPDNDILIVDLDVCNSLDKAVKDLSANHIEVLKIPTADSDINAIGPWAHHKVLIKIGYGRERKVWGK